MNAAMQQAQTFQTIGQIAGTVGTAAQAGLFDPKVTTTPEVQVSK
jgi:hypothetical protein